MVVGFGFFEIWLWLWGCDVAVVGLDLRCRGRER